MFEEVELAQRDGPQMLPLNQSIPTKFIKIEVTSVYGTINNGFAVMLNGFECKDENDVKKIEDVKFERATDPELVLLNCKSTVLNTLKIIKTIGKVTKVYCAEGCQFKIKYKFWGGPTFSGDSAICRSAFWQGLITEAGGEFELKYQSGEQK